MHHVHTVKDARGLVVANLLRVHQGLLRRVAGRVEAVSLLVLRRCGRQATIFRMVCSAVPWVTMGKPTPELYHQELRVLYYLHHHQHVGLRYGAEEFEVDMSGMSDSD